MVVTVGTFILAVAVTQVITFVLDALLYMNPLAAKYYKKYEDHPSMRKGGSQGKWMMQMFILSFISVFLAGLFFFITANAIPGTGWTKGLVFGLLLAGVQVYPRYVYFFMLTSYPKELRNVEFINGIIETIVIGLVFVYFL